MVEATPALPPAHAPAPVSTVLQMLRTATAAQHQALEARLPFMQPGLDRGAYRRIIEAYYGFHVPLQRHLQRFGDADAIARASQKIPALHKDLQALGLTIEQVDALPLCGSLPTVETEAQLLGILYVMEGATLGGQVLRRLMHEKLGIDADNGGEFLDVYGRDTGRLWKAFLKRLADFDHPAHNAEVADAACATFTCFQNWLQREGVLHDPR